MGELVDFVNLKIKERQDMYLKESIIIITVLLLTVVNFNIAKAETAEEWKTKGNEYLNKQEYDKALECYEKSLELDSNYARSVHNIGVVYNNKKEYQKALEYFDKALTLVDNGKDTSNLTLLLYSTFQEKGKALIGLNKNEEAVKCYEESIKYINKALENKPDDINLLITKGSSLFSLKKFEDAIKCFDKVLSIDKDNYYALASKGFLLSNLGKFKEAIEYYDKALKIKPDDTWCLNNKEKALASLKSGNNSVLTGGYNWNAALDKIEKRIMCAHPKHEGLNTNYDPKEYLCDKLYLRGTAYDKFAEYCCWKEFSENKGNIILYFNGDSIRAGSVRVGNGTVDTWEYYCFYPKVIFTINPKEWTIKWDENNYLKATGGYMYKGGNVGGLSVSKKRTEDYYGEEIVKEDFWCAIYKKPHDIQALHRFIRDEIEATMDGPAKKVDQVVIGGFKADTYILPPSALMGLLKANNYQNKYVVYTNDYIYVFGIGIFYLNSNYNDKFKTEIVKELEEIIKSICIIEK